MIPECPDCGWPVSDHDVCCGWCRKSLYRFKVRVIDEPGGETTGNQKLIHRFKDDIDDPLQICFQNDGPYTRTIRLSHYSGFDVYPETFELPPIQDSDGMMVKAVFQNDTNNEYCLVWKSEHNSHIQQVRVMLIDPPRLIPNPDLIELPMTDMTQIEKEIRLTLYNTDIYVISITCEPEWILCKAAPGQWKNGTSKDVTIAFKKIPDSEPGSYDFEMKLNIVVKNRKHPISVPVPVKIKSKAGVEILCQNDLQVDFHTNFLFTFSLKLTNAVDSDPDVEFCQLSFVLTGLPGRGSSTLKENLNYKWESGDVRLPSLIRSEITTYSVELQTSQLPAATQYQLQIQVSTNLQIFTKDIVLIVSPEKIFSGFMAIDFGTVSTHCAYLPTGSNSPQLISLQEGGIVTRDLSSSTPSDTCDPIPSTIFYQSFDNYLIGNEAETILERKELANHYSQIFDSVKRSIGRKDRMFNLAINGDFKQLTPKEVMRDYCSKVKQVFEKKCGRLGTSNNDENQMKYAVIMTYPTKFAWFQSEDIRWVAESIGVPAEQCYFIDEARAVAYYAMNILGAEVADNDHFMVVDIGGGTTDIAICQKKGPHFKVIDIAGDREFGGENITDWIMEKLVHQIELRCSPKKLYYRDNTKSSFNHDPITRDIITENRYTLRKAAFNIKRYWDSSNSQIILPVVSVWDDAHNVTQYPGESVDFKEWPEIIEQTQNRLNRIFTEVKAIVSENNAHLSLIILAGNGVRFSPIDKYIQQEMGIKTLRCNDLKGAVSLGAIEYARYITAGGISLEEKPQSRSGLGIKLPKENVAQLEFHELIPRNTPIPTLTPAIPFKWPRNRGSMNVEIWQRWGPRSLAGQDNAMDYIDTDVIHIPPEVTDVLNLDTCFFILRLLSDDSISCCKLFGISDIESFRTLLSGEVESIHGHGHYFRNIGIKEPDGFHPSVIEHLRSNPIFIMEKIFQRRK